MRTFIYILMRQSISGIFNGVLLHCSSFLVDADGVTDISGVRNAVFYLRVYVYLFLVA